MKYINIYGEKRSFGKKKDIRHLRSLKKIPCVVYGKNSNIPFSIKLEELNKFIMDKELSGFILKINGINKDIKALHKEIQYHPVQDNIIHIDFYEFEESKSINLNIPINFLGRPVGVAKGGEYYSPIKKLKIRTLPSNIPGSINIDISSLEIGDRITVKNLKNDKYSILHPDNTLIARVKKSRIIKITQEESIEKEKEKEKNNKKDNIKNNK